MGTSKELEGVDKSAAEVLQDLVQASGLSYRDIGTQTGMSINRIGKILRQEPPPASVGEIGKIANATGSTASAVVRKAELAHTAEVIQFPTAIGLSVVPDIKAAKRKDGRRASVEGAEGSTP